MLVSFPKSCRSSLLFPSLLLNQERYYSSKGTLPRRLKLSKSSLSGASKQNKNGSKLNSKHKNYTDNNIKNKPQIPHSNTTFKSKL